MARHENGGKPRRYRRWLRAVYILAAGPTLGEAARAIGNLARSGSMERNAGSDRGTGSPDAGAKGTGALPSRKSLEAQYEVADMGHLWVAFFGGGLFLGLATLLGFLWGLQTVLGRSGDWPAFRSTAIAHAGDSATVMRFRSHAPGLFPDPPGDLKRFQSAQAAEAPAYAWVDRRAGIISIPVARAMERIAEAGWPRWEFPGVKGGAAAQPVAPNTAREAGKSAAGAQGGVP